MSIELLKKRYKQFAIDSAQYIQLLPSDRINNAYCNQLIRSSSSPGANYRAACRAKSIADFINKLKIVEEELDESIYFLELLSFFNTKELEKSSLLMREGGELLAITVQSIKTSRAKQESMKKVHKK
jgi:four helix bundle protein